IVFIGKAYTTQHVNFTSPRRGEVDARSASGEGPSESQSKSEGPSPQPSPLRGEGAQTQRVCERMQTRRESQRQQPHPASVTKNHSRPDASQAPSDSLNQKPLSITPRENITHIFSLNMFHQRAAQRSGFISPRAENFPNLPPHRNASVMCRK